MLQQKVLEGLAEILKELANIEASKELALLVGNLNRAVGNGELAHFPRKMWTLKSSDT